MPSTSCPACGQQVMSYRRFALHLRPAATCGSCGARLSLGAAYWISLVGALLLLALLLAFSVDDPLTLLALFVLAFALDYLTWRYAAWRLLEGPPSAAEAGASPPAPTQPRS